MCIGVGVAVLNLDNRDSSQAQTADYYVVLSNVEQFTWDGYTVTGVHEDYHHVPNLRLEIPSQATVIGQRAFDNLGLTSVVIPDSVIIIDRHAFYRNNLSSVVIPDSVTHIEHHAFERNQIENLHIGNSVYRIWYHAFSRNQITSVVLPSSVVHVWHSAFLFNNITTVDLGQVQRIGEQAFGYNEITSIYIPKTVTYLRNLAFRGNDDIVIFTSHETPPPGWTSYWNYVDRDGTVIGDVIMGTEPGILLSFAYTDGAVANDVRVQIFGNVYSERIRLLFCAGVRSIDGINLVGVINGIEQGEYFVIPNTDLKLHVTKDKATQITLEIINTDLTNPINHPMHFVVVVA